MNASTLPAIRCVITPPNGMFHEGGAYQTHLTPTGTPNVFQVQDDLGHWRVMLWDELSFIVENGVVAKHAYFEIVED